VRASLNTISCLKHSDEWIEDRIHFQAAKHQLPQGCTHYFDEWPAEIQAAIIEGVATKECGKPVLLAHQSSSRWALAATRKFISLGANRLAAMRHVDIAKIKSKDFPPQNMDYTDLANASQLKHLWEYLSMHDADLGFGIGYTSIY
jgi:hypothetical protein